MSPLHRLWRLAAVPPARMALAVVLATLSLGSGVALLATSAWLISRAWQQPPILYLQVAIVAVRAFGLSRGVLRYAERLVSHDAVLRSLTSIRLAVFTRLERLSPSGLGGYRRGDLLARLVSDVDSCVDLLVRVFLPVTSALLVCGAAVTFAWVLLPAAGMVMLAMVVLSGVFAPLLTGQIAARCERGMAAAQAELTAEVVTGLAAAVDLSAFNATDAALERMRVADARVMNLGSRGSAATAWGVTFNTLASGAAVVGCLLVGVPAVGSGELNSVNLAVLALLPLAVADVLSGFPAAVLARSRVAGAAKRVFDVIDATDPVPPVPAGAETAVPQGPHSLAMTSVRAGYPGAHVDALREFSLKLKDQDLVGLVGPSGCGKSTVVALALRFLAYKDGEIRLSGVAMDCLSEEQVRMTVGALNQDVFLFDTTISENILLANRQADQDRLDEVVRAAGLTQWLAEIPAGLSTRVGGHGTAVSAGQRQRIGLARMLLADRPIRVLDEPTEHLESETGDALLADILQQRDRPTLLITHRMAATLGCDEVLVLDAGMTVERGRPADLMVAGGAYWELCEREQGAVHQ